MSPATVETNVGALVRPAGAVRVELEGGAGGSAVSSMRCSEIDARRGTGTIASEDPRRGCFDRDRAPRSIAAGPSLALICRSRSWRLLMALA
eukprot:5299903-Heterocapsa_arctica.AAC.1